MIGGENTDTMDDAEILRLPSASGEPRCRTLVKYVHDNFWQKKPMFNKTLIRLPMPMTGGVGTVLQKRLTICGGQNDAINVNASANCYRLTNQGWNKMQSLSKPRAFAASGWVPKRGWWITGGINDNELDGISTTDLFSIGDTYGEESEPKETFISGPVLPEGQGVSHHCLVRIGISTFLLIGGRTSNNHYSSKVSYSS